MLLCCVYIASDPCPLYFPPFGPPSPVRSISTNFLLSDHRSSASIVERRSRSRWDCPLSCPDPIGVPDHYWVKSFSCNTYGSPRKCCKQKTCGMAKPFKCNTYEKHGGGLVTMLNQVSETSRPPSSSRSVSLRLCSCSVFRLPYALLSSVSLNSFICRSHQNNGGVGVFFPIWNSSHGPKVSTHLRAIIGVAASASGQKARRG